MDVEQLKQFNVIPLNPDKTPAVSGWKHDIINKFKISESGFYGLICGRTSENVQCIDVDCKYDDTGRLWALYGDVLNEEIEDFKEKVCIQRTINKGYHIIFRCKTEISNLKLAVKENNEVLIETRGKGGYIAIDPSPGYKIIHGDLTNLPEISRADMMAMLNIARTFNKKPERKIDNIDKSINNSPLDDYNERGDAFKMLKDLGWNESRQKGDNIYLTRPGKTKGISASWDINNKLLYVFTSSTEFEQNKAYNQAQVYTHLRHNGNFSESSKDLLSQGFGKIETKLPEQLQKIIEQPKSKYHPNQSAEKKKAITALCDEKEGIEWIKQVRDGTIEKGKGFDIPSLDPYLVIKPNEYSMFLGNTNVGKTTIINYLYYRHIKFIRPLKLLCLYAEDAVHRIKRNLMKFYIQKPVSMMTDREIEEANDWIVAHFIFMRKDIRYSFVEVLEIADEVMVQKGLDGVIIDTYNSLKLDESLVKNIRGWDYHIHASNELQLWSHNNASIILSAHTVSSQQRLGSKSRPLLTHCEGGGMFSNKLDSGVVIHRSMDDSSLVNMTEIHVEKVKDVETGGKWTPFDEPVRLYMNEEGTKFEEFEPVNKTNDVLYSSQFPTVNAPF